MAKLSLIIINRREYEKENLRGVAQPRLHKKIAVGMTDQSGIALSA